MSSQAAAPTDDLEVPEAWFPANAVVPRDAGRAPSPRFQQLLRASTGAVLGLNRRLCMDMVPAAELERAIGRVRGLLAAAARQLASELPPGPDAEALSGRLPRMDALAEAFPDSMDHEIFGYAVYDEYFRVVRIPGLSRDRFGLQMLHTFDAVLAEIPDALLGLDEFQAISETMALMIRRCWPAAEAGDPVADEAEWFHASPPGPGVRGRGGREELANYRWKVGHHFFAFCAMWCGHCLDEALRLAMDGNAEQAAEPVLDAGSFLRGSTAAMWYASCFPASVYVEIIRPQMEATETRGFSGSQNLDYSQMLRVKRQLSNVVYPLFFDAEARFCDADGLEGFYDALVRLYETDMEDTEHHILIAAQRIGRRPSLLQMEIDETVLEKGEPPRAALDMLRQMGDGKRKTLEKLRASGAATLQGRRKRNAAQGKNL